MGRAPSGTPANKTAGKPLKILFSCLFALILISSLVSAGTNIQIGEVKVNEGLTHEVSNDTGYFIGVTGQDVLIDVKITNIGGDTAADVNVGMSLSNLTDSGINPDNVLQNRTVSVSANGETTTRFNWTVNTTTALPTGIYNISVFANSTPTEMIYNNSEYFKSVRLEFGNFLMEHVENNTARWDQVRFKQTVTNTGNITARAKFEISLIKDISGPDGEPDCSFDGTYDLPWTDISSGGEFDVEPGETVERFFLWTPTEAETCYTCDYGWNARSRFTYGNTWYGSGLINIQNTVVYRNVSYEYVDLNDEGVDNPELAHGSTVTGLVDIEVWLNATNSTIHERKGWVVDDEGNPLLDLVPHVTADMVKVATKCECPGNSQTQVTFNGLIPQSFSPNKTYTIVMAIDHGVPRENYTVTTSQPYSNFNDNATATFTVVQANLTDIYALTEVAYGVATTINTTLENLGTNSITEGNPHVDLKIHNSSYNKNQTSVSTLTSLQRVNATFYWTPQTSDLAPGLYNITATYYYGYSGETSQTSEIEVVSAGVANISALAVAPYETTNVSVNITNLGTTNVTINTANTTINDVAHLGVISDREVSDWSQFNFTFYFNTSYGFSNGSTSIKTRVSYGGTSFLSENYNITLLPVGIKSFSPPGHAVNDTPFNVTVILKNLASSNVTITLNLTSNASGLLNQSDVVALASSETTVNLLATLTDTGEHILYLTGNYTGLSSFINRSATMKVAGVGLESYNIPEDYTNVNESFTATAVVKNTGGTDATVTLNLTSSVSGLLNQTSVTVANGTNVSIAYALNLSDPGTHEINLSIDYTGLETPISRSDSIYIIPVRIQSLSAPAFAYNATAFDVIVTLRNLGSTAVTTGLNLTSNLSGSIENKSVVVAAGQDTISTFSVTLTQNGTHVLNVTLSYSPMPIVLFNTTEVGISQPDLSITSSDIALSPASPTPGVNVTITATVHNEGTLAVNNTKVELRINGTSMENKTIILGINTTNSTTFNWAEVILGTHNITVVVDPDNNVSEYNESNNNVTTTATVSTAVAPPPSGGGGGGVPAETSAITSIYTTLSSGTMASLLSRKEFKYKQFNSISGITGGEALSLAGTLISIGEYPEVEEVEIDLPIPVNALSGDIYESASKLVLSRYEFARTVVIARGDEAPDSLGAIAYAKANNIPILLTKPKDLPEVTYNAVKTLSPEKIIIVGEGDAISERVASRLGGIAKVERKGGKDRFETTLILASKIKDPDFVVITDGYNPDIEAAVISAGYKVPLIYVNGEEIPGGVKEYLKSPEIYFKKVVFGPSVSESVKKQIGEL